MNTPSVNREAFVTPLRAAINHVLDQAQWARQKLRPFAGRRIRLTMPPLALSLIIGDDGRLRSNDSAAESADLDIALPANAPWLALQGRDSVIKAAQIKGPADLADAFSFVLKNLRWDFEEDLSRVLGDVAAHRAATTLTLIARRQRQAAHNIAENVGEYLVEESSLLVKSGEFSGFADEVRLLRDGLDNIENKFNFLKEKRR